MTHDTTTDRRTFLGRAAAAATALAAPALAAPALAAAMPNAAPPSAAPDDRWLDALRTGQRMIFDSPRASGGLPMYHVRNYLDTYERTYGLKHPEVTAAVGLYYLTTPLAFGDGVWEKYQLGAAAGVVDAETDKPAVRNVLWKPRAGRDTLPIAGGPLLPPNDTAIVELQKRGALFLLCNNALNAWTASIGAATRQKAADVRAELLTHLIPDVVVVPAMVIAMQQAQARGASYMYLA